MNTTHLGLARCARMGLLSLLLSAGLFVGQGLRAAEPVNINTADAATLARELKGIGEARGKAIVQYRTEHGPFRSIDELALVKGIGPKVIERNRALLRVDRNLRPASAAQPAPARRP
jgi:competence protein ComEA